MKILILIVTLLPLTGQGLRPCSDMRTKGGKEFESALSLKEIHRLESRMDLIKDGMSLEEAFKVLKLSKKKGLNAVAHGAVTYRYLGEGYTLAVPFGTPDFLKRILLIDESGKVKKEIAWR